MADAPVWRGEPVTPSTIVDLWERGRQRLSNRTARIETAQALRRGTLTVGLAPEFSAAHPEVAASSLSVMPQRETLERDLIAKAGAAEPVGSRAPLDATETAARLAEEYEAYANEVAASEDGVPYQGFIEKGVEDGEYGLVVFPSELDRDGLPDFYDRLDERAYQKLDDDKKARYQPDENRPGYYARYEAGRRVPNPKYDRDARGKPPGPGRPRDPSRSKRAHEEAVRRYLIDRSATTFRLLPALDCVPILVRGSGRRRWEPVALVERTLCEREELEREYGWAMLGDQLLLPRGRDASTAQAGDQFYLYALYYLHRDEDGCEHTICCYTVGGAGTWYATESDPDPERVAWIDFYEQRGLEGRFFDYQFALHTSDDDPDWYGRPYLWALKNRILNVEGLETAANAATALQAYTGHYQVIEAATVEALERIDPEAIVDANTHVLRRPRIPGPGEVETSVGPILPHRQSQIGSDAWRLQQNYLQSLAEATMIDQVPTQGPSGYAMALSETLGQVAKRHVSEAALAAWEFALERDGRIRQAAFEQYGVRWPIQTTAERPVGLDMVEQQEVAEWDPDWIGDEGNYVIKGAFTQQFNLARADLEMQAYLRGVRGLKHVADAFGEPDVMALRVELAKDALWKEPASQELLRSTVDQLRGMKRQRQAAGLQADGRLTASGVPGSPEGVPAAMLRQLGEGGPGAMPAPGPSDAGGGAGIAASIRGGIQSGQMGGDRAVAGLAAGLGGVA